MTVLEMFIIFYITLGPMKPGIMFLQMTAHGDTEFTKAVALKTTITATTLCMIFVFAGKFVMGWFQVSQQALQIAGGTILILYAIGMVMGKKSGGSSPDAGSGPSMSTDIGIFPLAMPLMATPQGLVAIVTVSAATAGQPGSMTTITLLVLAVMAIDYLTMRAGDMLLKITGVPALNVTARVFGLLLVGLGMQLVIDGLTGLNAIPIPPTFD